MARYIDANELQKKLTQIADEPDYLHEGDTWDTGVYLAGVWVDKTPTADVVEVVRCGQCKWYLKGSMSCGHQFGLSSDRVMTTQFCSEGELKL